MKVLMKAVANMPIVVNGKRFRHEIKLEQNKSIYRVMFYQFVENKLTKRDCTVTTSNRGEAINYYQEEVLTLLTIFELP